MSSAVELHSEPQTESYDLMRLASQVADVQRSVDSTRATIASIEGALSDLGPNQRRQEALAAGGFAVTDRRLDQVRQGHQERLTNQRETLAALEQQLGGLKAAASKVPLGPLDRVAAAVLGRSVSNLALEERAVRLRLPEGSRPAELTLFSGRSIEF